MWPFKLVLSRREFRSPITVLRPTDGGYVGPEYVLGEINTLSMKATIVPATHNAIASAFPSDQEILHDEGSILEGSILVFSLARLGVLKRTVKGDVIQGYQGRNWEVLLSQDWSRYNFFVSLAGVLPEVPHG